jgi:hypothetical protein
VEKTGKLTTPQRFKLTEPNQIQEQMKNKSIYFFLLFMILTGRTNSQDFTITPPRMEFTGKQLRITYDLIGKNKGDQYFVWVEVEKRNGESIKIITLTGDRGDIHEGKDKQIIWEPERDSVFLNEEVLVEVKAEKYVKSFNKGSAMVKSMVLPGLGQTRVSKGKPYWLIGVATYGALAGGFVLHSSSEKNYDQYAVEEDPAVRKDLLDQAQKQLNMSTGLFISAAALWTVNVIWMAAMPNRYLPLKNAKLTVNRMPGPVNRQTLLTLRINF